MSRPLVKRSRGRLNVDAEPGSGIPREEGQGPRRSARFNADARSGFDAPSTSLEPCDDCPSVFADKPASETVTDCPDDEEALREPDRIAYLKLFSIGC